jgi:hypothetical protein
VILVVWLGLFGPTNASVWKDWQPLIAAFVAFGGAVIVYRSAMAKVGLDREIDQRNARRRQRGIFLRVSHAAYVMSHESSHFEREVLKYPNFAQSKTVDTKVLEFRTVAGLEEAWVNLDGFPAPIAKLIANLKIKMLNFEDVISRFEGRIVMNTPETNNDVRYLRSTLGETNAISSAIFKQIEIAVVSLDR